TDSNTDAELLRFDVTSHFILRLAYCKSEELKRWFLQQELDFFKFRFNNLTIDQKQEFLLANSLDYKPISDEEKSSILSDLMAAGGRNAATMDTQEFFKVPFTEVFDLIQRRRVFLSRGYAFVPRDDLVSIVITHYRTQLSHALAMTSRALPHLEEDNRLLPMLSGLSKRYLGEDYGTKKNNAGQVTADMIDMLSRQSFPLCMQQLHQACRRDHHLRHGGRQQYGLFLKGIGLSLEEAMKFWKTEFMKMMDGDKFDKNYSYNIRHNYGKEGKRADYTPYSCNKIIMSNAPGTGDNHGCPFRHTDVDLLAQKLRLANIGKDHVEKAISFVKGGHYQLACKSYFEATHPPLPDGEDISINHPNQYFDESRRVLSGEKKEGPRLSQPPRTPASKSTQPSQNTPQSQSSNPTQTQGAPSSQLSELGEMEDDDDLLASMDS
ncbi:hypothetical protein FSP39_014955, partial [Pinctada imbricata]